MSKPIRVMAFALVAMLFSSAAAGQNFDLRRLYFGAGVSQNKVSGLDNGTGFQVLGGYNFPALARNFYVDAEAGYMDTGTLKAPACIGAFCNASASGLWASAVARYMVAPNVELLGRTGYDFGDDDGFLFGVGAGYIVNKNLKLRLEFVARDNVDSLQFNVLFYPW
ncbi:MAG TPA: outer membrane beta-barrel protein [Burkholderiales bacterium]|jgi:hypothetical protein|nr:outer membrane beta-barrel protein [Burkholderiales bacterium]